MPSFLLHKIKVDKSLLDRFYTISINLINSLLILKLHCEDSNIKKGLNLLTAEQMNMTNQPTHYAPQNAVTRFPK